MIEVYKKFFLMLGLTIVIFIVVFNYPSYAFFSDTKLIKCSSTKLDKNFHISKKIFKYEKKLLSEPTFTERRKGVWTKYCSGGKLKFIEDSIMCTSKMYNSLLDLVTNQYSWDLKLKPIGKKEQRISNQYNCKITDK